MKKNSIRLMAGMLSAVMLFTSESMVTLAYTAPAEIFSETGNESVEEQNPEIPDESETAITEEDHSNETDPEAEPKDELPGDTETDQETEQPKEEEPGDIETEQPGDGNTNDTETEVPGEDNTDKLPAESTSEISVSENSTEPFAENEDAPEMTDFSIVDEGGNLLDETKILYIEENSYRQLHVKLTPENAVADEVKWSSDNARISVTDGKVTMIPTDTGTSDGGVISGNVSAQIGEITKTCKVEFQPLMKDIIIVDQNGVAVPDSGITIQPGQQKKLGVKISPEGAVVDGQQPRWTLKSTTYLRIDANTGILTVRTTPKDFPYEDTITATVTNPHTRQKVTATCKVTIPAPGESDGIRCGDILFYCNGMQEHKQVDATSWEISANQRSQCTLTYLGDEEDETEYAIFYSISSSGINTNNTSRPGTRYSKSFTLSSARYPLQFVLGSRSVGDRGGYTLSPVYTIQPTLTNYKSTFTISSTTIRSIPGGPDQEIQVRRLPDTCEMKDVAWISGDERLVKIKERTEKGVILQFGQSVGTTQITAVAKDYRGQECYATCQVKLSMTLTDPTFSSESGGEMEEEKIDSDGDTYQNTYWLIDKGGKVSLSVRGLPKAQIYYTINGKDPETNGTLYREPITINAKTTIKAYAKLEGYGDSAVSEMEFRLGTSKLSIPASVTVAQDSTKTITTVTLPTGANPGDVTWGSSDDEVASAETIPDIQYDDEGNETSTTYKHVITPGSTAGKCTITAYVVDYAGRTLSADCQVTVTGKLELTPAEITLKEGDSTDIKFKTPPKNVEIRWDYPAKIITLTSSAAGAKITANQLDDTAAAQTVNVTASMTVEMDVEQEDGTTEKENRIYSARCQVTVEPKSYEVTFLGWNDTVAKTETVNRGQAATPPTEEEMNAAAPKGYAFDGWEGENAWSNIQDNTIIKAKPYRVKSYTITYETGSEGSNSPDNPGSYKVTDNTIVLEDAIPGAGSEKSFAGWYLNPDYSNSPVAEIPKGSTGDITLYAKWSSAGKGLRIDAIEDQYYTGKAIQPKVQVYDGDILLIQGTDYTIKYKNNTNAADTTVPNKAPTVTVTGKGNYKGTDTAVFVIHPQSIAQEETSVSIPAMCLAYNQGKKLTVVPTVTWNGKKLKNNTEFKVTKIVNKEIGTEVAECKEVGDYTVTVSGMGNFSGIRDISLTVTDKKLLSKVKFKGKLTDTSWDTLQGQTLGEKNIAVDTGITLTDGQYTLQKGIDYTVTYNTDIKKVGTYEAVFTGIGTKYAGTVTKTFKIIGKPINASKLIIDNLKNLTYDGTAQTFGDALKISYKNGKNNDLMKPGEDYELSYENTTNAGNKATVVITGINGYTGIVKKTFKITPYSMKDDLGQKITISLENGITSVPYEKGGAKPKAIVKYGDTTLTEGKDYTVKYKNNTKVADKDSLEPQKAPSFTVTGKGNFTGSAEPITFSISAQDIGMIAITAEDVMAAAPNAKKGETIGKTGAGKYKSTPKLIDGNGKALSAGTDYLKTYTYTNESGHVLGSKDQVSEGSILTVTVQGTKNYTGETKVSYRVLAAKMSVAQASVSIKQEAKAAIKYDLEPVTLKKDDLVVKIGKQTLSNDDYTIVSYVNNRKKGTAKVTIQGVGEYGGRKTINFLINPRIFTFIKP